MRIKANRPLIVFKWIMYIVVTLQFLRIYIYNTKFYLRMPDYLSGRERLPFQERVLAAFFLNLFYKSPWMMNHVMTHGRGAFSRESGPFFFLSLLSLSASIYFLLKLYGAVSIERRLGVLVYPVFLVAVMLTYGNRLEQNFSYPYDFAAIAFFTAGLYFIYTRQFAWLLGVMIVGTLNRETTVFLIGIYALDAATVENPMPYDDGKTVQPIWKRLSFKQVPWARLALLTGVWIAIKLTLAHIYRYNDRSEDFPRLHYNLGGLSLRLVPAMLNLCGYLLPVVWVMRNYLRPSRFANYVYILPFWILVMINTGILVEVRIYGELCGYVAVACVLLLEQQCGRFERPGVEPVPLRVESTPNLQT